MSDDLGIGILGELLKGLLIIGVLGTALAMGGYYQGRKSGYEQGQIDALSGKNVKYELVKQSDGTTKWQHK